MATKKNKSRGPKKSSRKTSSRKPQARAARKSTTGYAKSLITDNEINSARKYISTLEKDIKDLDNELKDGGTIKVATLNKIVDSATMIRDVVTNKTKQS